MEKIKKIISSLSEGVFEKEEVIAVSLLAALAGQNIFLLGPPGTAKSLISRRLSSVFETKSYFEYLMQRFSTPEEIFGPISLTELKKDNYIRKTDGYLPEADFAFLDEIWKSSPAVLNTLLTIINEKKFRNGSTVNEVPLKVLISASNETPPENQGLDALYDRFLVRLMVLPTESKNNFESIIQNEPPESNVNIDKITNDDFELWQLEINEIKLSRETLDIIHEIRFKIEQLNKRNAKKIIYVSDRRWQRASRLLKAAAFFCDRTETNLIDTLLLRHCLWSSASDHEKIMKIVEEAVRKNGLKSKISFSELENKKNNLDKEIQKEFYFSECIYKTVNLNGEDYIKCIIEFKNTNRYNNYYRHDNDIKEITYYVPINRINTDEDFYPINEQGNEIDAITCNFKGQKSFSTQVEDSYIYIKEDKKLHESIITKLSILFNKGDTKKGINHRLFEALKNETKEFKDRIQRVINEINSKREKFNQQLDSPFVSEQLRDIAIESVAEQLKRISIVEVDCEHLQSKIRKAEEVQ